MNRRIHAYYSGAVQGVGFRFTAERLAGSLGLAGWVKNLRDGRVEIICEGKEPDLKSFLEKMHSTFRDYVRDADVEWDKATGEFAGFDIVF